MSYKATGKVMNFIVTGMFQPCEDCEWAKQNKVLQGSNQLYGLR